MDIVNRVQPGYEARYQYGEDPNQFGELRVPDRTAPAAVIVGIHGGWWRAEHGLETHSHLCAALTAHGFATWNIEYRRIGQTGGGWPGTFHDVCSSIEFLRLIARRHNLDLSRVITLGFSAGGPLALWGAARSQLKNRLLCQAVDVPVTAAISLAGAVDLIECARQSLSDGVVEQFMGGNPQTFPERYALGSPAELMPIGVPHTLIHGTNDTSVPHQISERYFNKANQSSDECRLISLSGKQHFELIDPTVKDCFDVTLNTIKSHIQASSVF